MNTTLFHTALEQYGLVIYADDNEIALVMDDGTIEWVERNEVQRRKDPQATIRLTLWQTARGNFRGVEEAAEHYSQTLKIWLRKVANAGKTCGTCKEFKHFSEFHTNLDSADGYRTDCKVCRSVKAALRYKERHPEV